MIQKLWHNGPLWNALGSLMYGANTFFLMMFVSRFAGVEAAGDFGIAFTTAQLLYQIGIFGASNFHMTDYREEFSFSSYAQLKAVSCTLMALAAVAACLALGFSPRKTVLTLILTAYMLAHAVSELWQNRMFQKNRLDLSGQCLFFRTLISLVVFSLCLLAGVNLTVSCLVLSLTNIAAIWLIAWLPCRAEIPAPRKPEQNERFRLLRACLPLFFSLLLMNLVVQVPKYTVDEFCTPHQLGVFNMIFMPVQVINLVSGFIFRPMLKTMADQVADRDWSGLYRLLLRQFFLVGGFILACLAGAWLLGIPVLGFLYSADLSGFRRELLAIILGGGVYALCQVLYYTVLLFRHQGLILWNYAVCTAVFLPVCTLLTRQFGIMGAIIGFIGIHLLLLLGYLLILAAQMRRLSHD